MKRLVIGDLAKADLQKIQRYTEEQWEQERKTTYMAAIRSRLSTLRMRAEIGRRRADLGRGYRSLLIGAHVTFYRVENNDVIVVRILHQAMDVKRHL